ncbi:MAG TPA: hypothetical protein VN688_11285 [Gemmataceae bacterium]|nr:hypothetical protein [Gemmataceae bacterium]
MSLLKGFLNLLHAFESAMGWLLRYPLLPLQILLFFLVAWGRLGYELGVEDLFWSEHIGEEILNGLGCGLLFGEILLVRYLLDSDRAWVCCPVSLLPVADADIKRLGQYLLMLWIPSLLILWGGKLFFHDARAGYINVWPLLLGLALAVGASVLGIILADRSGLLARLQTYGRMDDDKNGSLHAVAFLTALLSVLILVLLYVLHFSGAVLSPVLVLCVLLGLADAVYGFLAFWMPGSQYVALVLLVAIALGVSSSTVSRDHAYKLTFPNLEERYANPLRIDEELVSKEGDKHKRLDHYYELLKTQADEPDSRPDLIPSEEPLRAMAERWRNEHKGKGKPRLVLVSTSGGGIRAAVWTAVVLEGLERELGTSFRDHIRLFTGASGGMVGAALYVADFENTPAGQRPMDPATGLRGVSGDLAKDSLRRTVQTMLLRDLPTLWQPGSVSWDRGREIERLWAENCPGTDGRSPFRKSFGELKELERQGRRPSLVFAPMLVEDARRLLVSNLDLLDLTWTSGDATGLLPFRTSYPFPAAPDRPLLSLSAVELFRLFPGTEAKFEVGTASRMNASFPLVSPGVSLPTDPPRRVVDAGYYDNYGVNLAAMWLYRHEQAIREHTSGVVLIEIRAYRNGYARWHFQDKEAEKQNPDPSSGGPPRRDRDALQASLEWLSTPVEALLNARERAAYYRNDELLDGLDKHFNRSQGDFFTTVAFECEVDAALSWTLPTGEARVIAQAFHRQPDATDPAERMPAWIHKRVGALKKWFGEGGR